MLVLNLGCGTKVSAHPDVVNVDWSPYLRIRKNPLLRRVAPLLVGRKRMERFRSLPENIVVADLRRGVPFDSESVDAVYHSHLIEHLSRDAVIRFIEETKRLLAPGGVIRIVAPDFESACSRYLEHLSLAKEDPQEADRHDKAVAEVIEQFVRVESHGTSNQSRLRRFVENVFLGDARKRGEVHRWAYDRVNLCHILKQAGFVEIRKESFDSSSIPNWEQYGLDLDDAGAQYRPMSLYIEAKKPGVAKRSSSTHRRPTPLSKIA